MPGQMSRESVGSTETQANAASYEVTMSADGRFVAFDSAATNLVAGTTARQIYLRDRQLLETTVVSVSPGGAYANFDRQHPVRECLHGRDGRGYLFDRARPVGRWVSFISYASTLVANDGNATADVFLRDLVTATTEAIIVTRASFRSTARRKCSCRSERRLQQPVSGVREHEGREPLDHPGDALGIAGGGAPQVDGGGVRLTHDGRQHTDRPGFTRDSCDSVPSRG
jgi:hypothetical protein